jgi:hypothetical protein
VSVERVHKTTLHCDTYGCPSSLQWETVHYLSGTFVLQQARKNGWTVKGDKAFCPIGPKEARRG